MPTAIVSSVVGGKPFNGGNAWAVMSWADGLSRLGYHVIFVEQISSAACTDADGQPATFERSVNRDFFNLTMSQLGFLGRSALVCDEGAGVDGMSREDLIEAARQCDLLINISGHLTWAELKDRCRRKVYLDLDPGFTQIWHADGNAGPRLKGHDFYYTIGQNIGSPVCSIPTAGISWRTVRQPVVLECWPICNVAGPPVNFTTIASWRGPYGPVTFGGKTFGIKVHEFRKFLDLPRRLRSRSGEGAESDAAFEIALDIHPADVKDIRALNENGWNLVDPRATAGDALSFRQYVQASGAEFSAAQGIYVETHSGWFSDRTVKYLACGKPALVQDTGFGRTLPVGEGLFTFNTLEEAEANARRIIADYPHHSAAARRIAEEYFESSRVLGRMLEEIA